MNELNNLLEQASERWPGYFYPHPYGKDTLYEIKINGNEERIRFAGVYLIRPEWLTWDGRLSGTAFSMLFEACVRLAIGVELGIQLDKDSLQPKLTRVRLCLGPHSWVGTANESEHHSYAALRALLSLPEEFSRRE